MNKHIAVWCIIHSQGLKNTIARRPGLVVFRVGIANTDIPIAMIALEYHMLKFI
jgi:hypothetical protein